METMKIKRGNIHSLADIKSKSSKVEEEKEKEYIDIASTIDNIQGLLLDIYINRRANKWRIH